MKTSLLTTLLVLSCALPGWLAGRALLILAPAQAGAGGTGRDQSAVTESFTRLAGQERQVLESLLQEPGWQAERPEARILLSALAEILAARGGPGELAAVVGWIRREESPLWQRKALLQGVERALAGGAAADTETLTGLLDNPDPELKEAAARILGDRKPSPQTAAVAAPPLTPEQEALYQQGKFNFEAVCAGCHLESGQGMKGFAPPLVNSPWVLGPDKFLAMIVLQGKEGGPGYQPMPPLRGLDDQRIASILTYIRRQWGHQATPVRVETVEEVRRLTADRARAWRERELQLLLEEDAPPQ